MDGGNTAKYNYDAFGNRAMQYAPPVYNEYVVDLTGRPITAIKPGTSTVYTAEVFAGGRHWVTDNGSALFLGADWVGTSRALTNLGGTFDQLYTSLPWGDGLSFAGGSSLHTTSQYTGKEFDSETGLYHFPARQYAPVQGRWLTPDPAGVAAMNIANPQTWNRYSYVTNNPVTRTDPSGLLTGGGGGGPCDVGDCGGGDPCQFGLCGPSGPCDFTGDCGGGTCNVGDCGGSQGVPPGGRTNPPTPNSIFSGQDCLFCFPLGPSPLQILQAVLSGNLAGALQNVGAIPSDGINCEFGTCQVNPLMDANPTNCVDQPCVWNNPPCEYMPCFKALPPIPTAYQCTFSPSDAVPELPGAAPEQPDAAPGPPPPLGRETGQSKADFVSLILGYLGDTFRCWVYKWTF